MDGMEATFVMLTQIVNLGMAVMARCNAVGGASVHNLIKFSLSIGTTRIRKPGLQEPASSPAAEVIGKVRGHVNIVFLAYHGLHHKPQIMGNWIPKRFTNQLARILNRKFNFKVPVPIGADL
jgi:hypothetical protein